MPDNMDPEIWGESFWNTIHYIAINYPNNPTAEDKKNVKIFFVNLSNLLPCEKCRHHYKLNLIKYPLSDKILSSKMNLFRWTNELHNEVNVMNGKNKISLEEAHTYYISKKTKINTNTNTIKYNNTYIIIVIMILLIVIMIYYLKN